MRLIHSAILVTAFNCIECQPLTSDEHYSCADLADILLRRTDEAISWANSIKMKTEENKDLFRTYQNCCPACQDGFVNHIDYEVSGCLKVGSRKLKSHHEAMEKCHKLHPKATLIRADVNGNKIIPTLWPKNVTENGGQQEILLMTAGKWDPETKLWYWFYDLNGTKRVALENFSWTQGHPELGFLPNQNQDQTENPDPPQTSPVPSFMGLKIFNDPPLAMSRAISREDHCIYHNGKTWLNKPCEGVSAAYVCQQGEIYNFIEY